MGVADHVLESIQRPSVAPDAGALLAHPPRREAAGARRAGRRSACGRGNANGNQNDEKDAEIEAVVEVSDDLTSQSRHSLLLHTEFYLQNQWFAAIP